MLHTITRDKSRIYVLWAVFSGYQNCITIKMLTGKQGFMSLSQKTKDLLVYFSNYIFVYNIIPKSFIILSDIIPSREDVMHLSLVRGSQSISPTFNQSIPKLSQYKPFTLKIEEKPQQILNYQAQYSAENYVESLT